MARNLKKRRHAAGSKNFRDKDKRLRKEAAMMRYKEDIDKRREAAVRKAGMAGKPVVTVSLDDPTNPYYKEGRKLEASRARQREQQRKYPLGSRGTLGGVYALTPIDSMARAMIVEPKHPGA